MPVRCIRRRIYGCRAEEAQIERLAQNVVLLLLEQAAKVNLVLDYDVWEASHLRRPHGTGLHFVDRLLSGYLEPFHSAACKLASEKSTSCAKLYADTANQIIFSVINYCSVRTQYHGERRNRLIMGLNASASSKCAL